MCEKCAILADMVDHLKGEISFLRGQISKKDEAFEIEPSPDYVGSGQDEYVMYDEFGARVIVEKDINIERPL